MPPTPLAVEDFLVVGWWLGNIISARLFFMLGFRSAISLCCNACWLASFCMLVFMHCLAFAAAWLQPLTIAHCFETLCSNRFDGFVGC